MPALETPICAFGTPAPAFTVKGVDGKTYTLENARGPNGLLVMFICNHCPFVKAVADRLPEDMADLQKAGIGVIAISSNDVVAYPEDDFEHMKKFAAQHGFNFPYAIDETQAAAKAYGAVCTPDFFGYNHKLELQYRGRLDDAGRNPRSAANKRELVDAMLWIAESGHGPKDQKPSMGCSIKWK
jgi:peroxiredoxin